MTAAVFTQVILAPATWELVMIMSIMNPTQHLAVKIKQFFQIYICKEYNYTPLNYCSLCYLTDKMPNLFGFSGTPVQPTEAPPQTGRSPNVFDREMKKIMI